MSRQPGERVVFRRHPSWLAQRRVYVRGLVLGLVVGIVAGLAAAAFSGRVQTAWVLGGVLVGFGWRALKGLRRRLAVTYSITDRRVMVTRGLLRRRVQAAWLEEIVEVVPRQSRVERMLGIGSVHILCDEADVVFAGVDDPRVVARAVDSVAQDARRFVAHRERIAA